MKHSASQRDREYLLSLEGKTIDTSTFDHRGHLRIAYTLLVESDVDEAHHRLRNDLLGLLEHLSVGRAKYHETITYAWLLAVNHFMAESEPCDSFEDFIDNNEWLLDQDIMYSHYSKSLLLSDQARAEYVPPNLRDIPRH